MSAVEILRQARELIADKSRWTQGYFARIADGREASHSSDEDAVCWCAKGAVLKLTGARPSREPLLDLLDNVAFDLFGDHVVAINDDTPLPEDAHQRILRIYDEAIKRVEAANA